jgi:hypothetical protein
MALHRYLGKLLRDLFVVVASIIAAVIIIKLGFFDYFTNVTGPSLVLSSLVAGAFFTSIFTLAPAGVALIALSQSFPPVLVAFFGALGAALVDVVIIAFIRKGISKDLENISKVTFRHHLLHIFHFGFLKWVAFAVGMFFVATPLPDELGLFLLGMSRINHKLLPLIFFLGHFIGIWALISIASAL